MTSASNDPPRPDGALPTGMARRHPHLAQCAARDLAEELLARMQAEPLWHGSSEMAMLGARLEHGLRDQLDVHLNRFSTRHHRDLFDSLFREPRTEASIAGATVLNVGCGGVNPSGLLFVLLALGAARGVAVDLDTLVEPRHIVRTMGDLAATLLLDATRIVGKALAPDVILRNLASFDLGRLGVGDGSGLDSTRLRYLQESAAAMSLGDGEVDLVISVSFFEHVDDADAVIRELVRVMRIGAIGTHVIDLTDHRRYGGACHPLQFLCEPGTGMAHGSNRLRASDFVQKFRAAGLRVRQCATIDPVEVDAQRRDTFVEPFRSMSLAELGCGVVRIVTEKVAPGEPT